MNILTEKLPTEINGCKVNSDFRIMLQFSIDMLHGKESNEEKLLSVINNFFIDIPKTLEEAVESILWFYRFSSKETTESNKSSGNYEQAISFQQDSNLIFSAFLSQYNINLNSIEYLHWWEFKALLEGLKEDEKLSKVMAYRLTDTNKMKGEEKKFYNKMKELYRIDGAIKKKMTLEERNQEMKDYVAKRIAEVKR